MATQVHFFPSRFRKHLLGTDHDYYDINAAIEAIKPESFQLMPYTMRIWAEQILRRCSAQQAKQYLTQLIERQRTQDFPWYPCRVVCHDILGQTAFVDLAGLRDAIAEQGGDPTQVNPLVETQLIVDHSLSVEYAGFDAGAFEKNRDVELRRNKDRFDFIDWCKDAFDNVRVIPAGNGIMHQINLEKMATVVRVEQGVVFPDTCIGTDSHTPHVDALGVLAIGVGGLEAETVMLGQPSMMRLPDIIGVELVGQRQAGITATDIVLALTEFLRDESVVASYLEFFGEGIHTLTVGDRATISNMTPEYGASAAMFYIDEQTLAYLRQTGREEHHVGLVECYAKAQGLWADQLSQVQYDRTLQFDLSTVTRNLAGPSNPHRRIATHQLSTHPFLSHDMLSHALVTDPLSSVALTNRQEQRQNAYEGATGEELREGAIIIAAITSCTNTSNPRSVVAAALVAKKANQLGLMRKPWVKTSFAPGSKVVSLYLEQAQLLPELEKQGFGVVGYACTTCNGMSGALDPKIEKEIIERDLYVTAVLSGNRNFDGRIHPYAKQAFLASPPLVVAYAIAGNIHTDIENAPLGYDSQGLPIRLSDLWPSEQEIDSIVAQFVKPELYQTIYTEMFSDDDHTRQVESRYRWHEQSTYIRRPPYWDRHFLKAKRLENLRPLVILGDNVTTDHLSPSNAILPDSAAGEYLASMGLAIEDFNSYATHRGDHHTAQRATLANPKLVNEMVPQTGSWTRVQPDNQLMRIWEAIEVYMSRQQPLIVIAGKNYGQGSSRDWAAKGVKLAGVQVVLAESFERIHRTNLVGMGVLPLEFTAGACRHDFNFTGTEQFSVVGEVLPDGRLTLMFENKSGVKQSVAVICRLETQDELSVYQAGGVLQRFAQQFLQNQPQA